MREELKPCPFCGSHGEELGLNSPDDLNGWFIRCYRCNIETAEEYTREEVVAAWNTRPTPPQEERSDPLSLAAADDNRKGLAGAAATHSLTGAKVHIIGPDETDETKVRVRCFDGSEQSVRLSRLAIALPADDNHKALVEALREAEATFEDIRVRLISNLDEPERTAFWRAADGRTKVAQALAAFQSRQEESRSEGLQPVSVKGEDVQIRGGSGAQERPSRRAPTGPAKHSVSRVKSNPTTQGEP